MLYRLTVRFSGGRAADRPLQPAVRPLLPRLQSATTARGRGQPRRASAAAGVTGTARTPGAALSPALAGPMLASSTLLGFPFVLSGALKIVYDLLL